MFAFLKKIFITNVSSESVKETQLYSDNEWEFLVLNEFYSAKSYEKVLKSLPSEIRFVADQLIGNKELVKPPIEVQIDISFRVPDLKKILKNNEIPISGNKDILIQRLVSNNAALQCLGSLDIYQCSDNAKHSIDRWKNERALIEENYFEKVLSLVKVRKIEEAVDLTAEFKKRYPKISDLKASVSPLGINISKEKQCNLITLILSSNPKILSGYSEIDLEQLRVSTVIWQLGWTGQWIDKAMEGFSSICRFSSERSRMLLFIHARHTETISVFSNIKGGMRFRLSSKNGCENCAALDGKCVDLSEMPEIPNPDCCSDGCAILPTPLIYDGET
ncbi:SAP domain-containing protein [Undibacterium oligocarboniphilum]|uniref:SAP domain-containing protein n=1 Tax=Undibacterium oligocarboniphilum TaxID=666702 RepID=A0A850QL75_9BURK|nr:SAP domain-containing protein [Undibacterium oligocarboniphilum]MBC3870304.1 SAP domain-containing protein [Undibacterium oligocarboniphilum]NVO78295.1 SAP domain-containing protein [Undibacterium oligocarboniphilum]